MNRRKLDKLSRELQALRRGQCRAADLEGLARRLGRKANGNRGKEPMWESGQFNDLPPLAIPHHGGRDLSPGVQKQLLNLLEDDILRWEELIGADEGDGSEKDQDDDGS